MMRRDLRATPRDFNFRETRRARHIILPPGARISGRRRFPGITANFHGTSVALASRRKMPAPCRRDSARLPGDGFHVSIRTLNVCPARSFAVPRIAGRSAAVLCTVRRHRAWRGCWPFNLSRSGTNDARAGLRGSHGLGEEIFPALVSNAVRKQVRVDRVLGVYPHVRPAVGNSINPLKVSANTVRAGRARAPARSSSAVGERRIPRRSSQAELISSVRSGGRK